MPHQNPKLAGSGVHHVALRSPDFDRSVEFYTHVLGCSPKMLWRTSSGSRAVMLDVGDGNYLEIFERPEHETEPPTAAEARWLHLCLRCTNLDAVIEEVRSAGMTVTVEPKDVPIENLAPGQKSDIKLRLAFFTGPDGEIIELMQCEDL